MSFSIRNGNINGFYSGIGYSIEDSISLLALILIVLAIGIVMGIFGVLAYQNYSNLSLWLKGRSWPSLSRPKGFYPAILYFCFNVLWLLVFMIIFQFWYFSEAPKHLIRPSDGTEVAEFVSTDYIDDQIGIIAVFAGITLFSAFWIASRLFVIFTTSDSRKYYFLRYRLLSPVIAGFVALMMFIIFLFVVHGPDTPPPERDFIVDSTIGLE